MIETLEKFGLMFGALLLCSVFGIHSADSKDTISSKQKVAGQKRTIDFHSRKSLGALYLSLASDHCVIDDQKYLGPATGKVQISVPDNQRLIFEPNRMVLEDPELMSGISPSGIDILCLQALEMDEIEKGRCDRLIKYAAQYLKGLREVFVDSSDVTDRGISYLENMPALEAISTLSCYGVKGRCLPALGKIPKLERLSLRGHKVDQAYFKFLPSLAKLTYLNVRNVGLDRDEVKTISHCLLLESLDLAGNKIVDDESIQYLLALKHLRRLSIADTNVTDRGIAMLARFSQLQAIDLNRTCVTPKGLAALKSLKLKELRISNVFSKVDLQKIGPNTLILINRDHQGSLNKDDREVFQPLH